MIDLKQFFHLVEESHLPIKPGRTFILVDKTKTVSKQTAKTRCKKKP